MLIRNSVKRLFQPQNRFEVRVVSLYSLGRSERFWGLYFHLRKEVWAMSIEGYMLAMELPLLLFLYYIYVYK